MARVRFSASKVGAGASHFFFLRARGSIEFRFVVVECQSRSLVQVIFF
jgi:hypothetical protein